jgi:(1->4)-alpha-D-glucan 1-alpha-D-glucosylmutase
MSTNEHMTSEEALDRLCALCGIAAEYTDIWGRTHRVSVETQRSLLEAMGLVVETEGDLRAALEEREARPWQRLLPPVLVVRESEGSLPIPVTVPAELAEESFSWELTEESGDQREGTFHPLAQEAQALGVAGGASLLRYHFFLPSVPGLGYHRLTLRVKEREASMTLIVVPAACYQPKALAEALAGGKRIWGPTVQLYALRSQRNGGMGDFTDLRALIDLAVDAGAGVVCLSPLHALFPTDPSHASPYSPSSRLFLNTLFLDVEAVPDYAECAEARQMVSSPRFQSRLRALREESFVAHEAVASAKRQVLEILYRHFCDHHLRQGTDRARAFRAFQAAGGEALRRFALFDTLQEHFHSQDPAIWGWPAWPGPYRDVASPAVADFAREQTERVECYEYLQWEAESQLEAAGRRALDRGLAVGLYQDLAVGVASGGAETWAWRDLYAPEARIGAPPDDFNLQGQDWGLAPFIPWRLREAAYAPFIATLRANMRHAGALRIDHVMGLMRLFWVPPGGTPMEGTYVSYPFEDLLGIVALESRRNRCVVVGEDLGTVPDAVREALKPMGVFSYRLLYFEREPDGRFNPPAKWPSQAVAAASTHDLPTLKGYWQGRDLALRAELGLYPSNEVRERQVASRAEDRAGLLAALDREGLLPAPRGGEAVPEMTPALALAIHRYLARTPSRMMVVQPEDLFGQMEQANLPGTTTEHPNWRRKLSVSLEEWPQDPRWQALAEALRSERSA